VNLDIDRLLKEDAERWRATLPPQSGENVMPARPLRRARNGRRRMVTIAAAVAAVLAVAGGVVGLQVRNSTGPVRGFVDPAKSNSGLTSAQKTLALRIAHEEADGNNVGGPAVPSRDSWPAHVDSVSALVSTAEEGAQYVGGSTSAQGEVLIIRLVGEFSMVTTGPPGHGYATGNELTVLVPLNTSEVSDAGIERHKRPADLPNSTNLFTR
jgi:hypothetical protein